MRIDIRICIIIIACLCFISCKSLGSLGDTLSTKIEDISGGIDTGQYKDITKSLLDVVKGADDFSPEQEYYIGRAVGASVLAQYEPYENEKANNYINTLGQTLAIFSDKPEIFEGYHFLILDSEEINAFATPSGLVFVTVGLLRLTTSEDSVATILAHEIGHIVEKHGIKSIKQANMTAGVTGIVVDAADTIGIQQLEKVTETFTDSINDVTVKLVVNGYSREYEKQADEAAVDILIRVGYNPRALIELLEIMDKSYTPGGHDFAKTHPAPKKRINAVENKLKGFQIPETSPPKEREVRYQEFYSELR